MVWRKKFGAYGYTVELFERTPDRLYVRYLDPQTGKRRKVSLGHGDRVLGEQRARELMAALAAGALPTSLSLTVAALFARYEREVSRYKKGAQPEEDRRRSELWCAFLGGDRQVATVDFPTIDRFVRARAAGHIAVPNRRLRPNPKPGTIGADIVYLQAALNWATTVTSPDGDRLLDENPVRGYRRPQSRAHQRPLATYDRFLVVRKHADGVDPQRLFGAFLELIEALGWRVTAICKLWASDVDRRKTKRAPYGRIRKRGTVDKEGVEQWVPLTKEARAAVDQVQERNAVVGDVFLFPAPRRARKAWSRWHARDLLERAEAAAGISPLEGGDFHPYRRKWATERKHLPDADVMEAGGWTDDRSLKRAYQQPDQETMLRVVSEKRKLREVQ
jgi:hypothetical protein